MRNRLHYVLEESLPLPHGQSDLVGIFVVSADQPMGVVLNRISEPRHVVALRAHQSMCFWSPSGNKQKMLSKALYGRRMDLMHQCTPSVFPCDRGFRISNNHQRECFGSYWLSNSFQSRLDMESISSTTTHRRWPKNVGILASPNNRLND